jgi:hypothetical protein
MRNLRRRIETLEKSWRTKRHARQGIAEKAMSWLWPDDAEQLISAHGAGRVGRPLTEREVTARRKCTEALERECRWAGTHSIRCDHKADINEDILRQAAICVLACRLSSEQLELCSSGIRGAHEGREPNERETAASEAHSSEIERLSQLAGFGSIPEFEALMWSVDVAESANRF